MLSHEAQCDGIVAVGHDAVLCDALTLRQGFCGSRRSLRKSPAPTICYAASGRTPATERFFVL